ncbi:hypothetical protein [Paracoccus sp. Z118]|uniref:hypothetical protein n=1 Tax=Paracoccus sp. Z118 TaxID=2851017 RepID=UPI0035302A4E
MTRTDDFLGGRLRLTQLAIGYRAGTDAVMLAAACPAEPGQSVLELGCGAAAAAALWGRAGDVVVLPVASRLGALAARVGVCGRRGAGGCCDCSRLSFCTQILSICAMERT